MDYIREIPFILCIGLYCSYAHNRIIHLILIFFNPISFYRISKINSYFISIIFSEFIFESIQNAYDTAEIYLKRFDVIRNNFEVDINTDPKTIRAEQNVTALREYCQRYNDEMQGLEGIVPKIFLGILQLKQTTFKEEIIPVCRNLLTVLDSHVPK